MLSSVQRWTSPGRWCSRWTSAARNTSSVNGSSNSAAISARDQSVRRESVIAVFSESPECDDDDRRHGDHERTRIQQVLLSQVTCRAMSNAAGARRPQYELHKQDQSDKDQTVA